MVYSTFSSIMTARSGISVAQLGLNVTSQNMANVNTRGYTRQRLDTVSVGSYNGPNTIAYVGASVSGGTKPTGVSQIRDTYLDARFRSELANYGEMESNYSILSQLEDIFNQWSEDSGLVITKMFEDLIDALSQINNEDANFDVLAMTQAELITSIFHSYQSQLDNLREQEVNSLKDVDIPRVNDILAELAELNKAIQRSQATGQQDWELTDARNLLLDELSQYMDIKVSYSKNALNPNVEDISVELVTSSGSNVTLVSNKDVLGSFSLDAAGGTFGSGKPELVFTDASTNASANLTDLLNGGILKGTLDMLNKAGPLDTPPNTTYGIGYYEELMNTLVDTFAKAMNALNTDGTTTYPLFDDGTGTGAGPFTMANIKIADGWRDGTYGIVTTNEVPNAMIAMLQGGTKFTFTSSSGVTVYQGSLQDYFGWIETTLAANTAAAKTRADNQSLTVNAVDNTRYSISSVSMDEETVNLIMYQKAYNASSRMMTTLDEALDQLINKTGIVGR